ncbi:MAG TPA: D,D-peptidase/D,D-carboxypeptidase VanY-N [Pseudonocardiaceae bacterium]|nr:D,D-peptidase/D,D-carboxypeptidase VanY-N [Pseudonocardiaceae bacterium]
MNEQRTVPDSFRDRVFAAGARALGVALLPAAYLRSPGRARYLACQWALATRYPRENLAGLRPAARAAFTEARAEAFWRDRQLIGLTSGHRDAGVQQRMFEAEVRRTGSVYEARLRVLPAAESRHVQGVALDVRPSQGAGWLERNGARYDLYRRYDNEWWHFEHCPGTRGRKPEMLPYPGAVATSFDTGPVPFLTSMSGTLL